MLFMYGVRILCLNICKNCKENEKEEIIEDETETD